MITSLNVNDSKKELVTRSLMNDDKEQKIRFSHQVDCLVIDVEVYTLRTIKMIIIKITEEKVLLICSSPFNFFHGNNCDFWIK